MALVADTALNLHSLTVFFLGGGGPGNQEPPLDTPLTLLLGISM